MTSCEVRTTGGGNRHFPGAGRAHKLSHPTLLRFTPSAGVHVSTAPAFAMDPRHKAWGVDSGKFTAGVDPALNSRKHRDTSQPVDTQTSSPAALDTAALAGTPCLHDPYDHVIVPGFVRRDALPAIHDTYPDIRNPGSFPYQSLDCGPAFSSLLDELQGPEMRAAIEQVFDVDLTGRPTTITVRGQCQTKDGRIHPDSAEKIITVLVYMNPEWEDSGGRLRVLRSAGDLEDFAAEVPPDEGTLLAFRRSDISFHGHQPFEGKRRVLQLNWVTSDKFARRERRRHAISAFFKRLGG